MTTTKIAVTLPEEQVAAARQAVAEGRARSVSTYIADSLARRSADDELPDMLAEVDAEHGEPTAETVPGRVRVLGLEP